MRRSSFDTSSVIVTACMYGKLNQKTCLESMRVLPCWKKRSNPWNSSLKLLLKYCRLHCASTYLSAHRLKYSSCPSTSQLALCSLSSVFFSFLPALLNLLPLLFSRQPLFPLPQKSLLQIHPFPSSRRKRRLLSPPLHLTWSGRNMCSICS